MGTGREYLLAERQGGHGGAAPVQWPRSGRAVAATVAATVVTVKTQCFRRFAV